MSFYFFPQKENRPVFEQKILKTLVLSNPFDDIVPRVAEKKQKSESKKKKREEGRGVK